MTSPTAGRGLPRRLASSAVGVLAVFCLLVGLLAAFASQDPSGLLHPLRGHGQGAVQSADQPAAPCTDLAIFGVDGRGRGWTSGDSTFDPVLKALVGGIRRHAFAAGMSVGSRHLGVAFADDSVLAPAGSDRSRADQVVTKASARAWLGDTVPLVRQVLREIRVQAVACPEQIFVVVGHAQGASVAHRTLLRADAVAGLQGRLVGGALVSDGDRRSGSVAVRIGRPAAPAAGRGVLPHVGLGVKDVPTAFPVVSVCTRGDLVCDLRGSTLKDSRHALRSYGAPASRFLLRAAGTRMSRQATAWPRPVDGQKVVISPGASLSLHLRVKVGAPYASGVVYDGVAGLPSGLTLAPNGVLSGAVASTGTYQVTFKVHGTSPDTSRTSGRVTVIVASPTAGAQLGAGGEMTCSVDSLGTAYCAGQGGFGQLGQGDSEDHTTAVQVGAAGQWATISAGGASACAITTDGELYCWGSNARGQLGQGGGHAHGFPQRVGTSNRWTQVSVGWFSACAVRSTGTLWCWGGNADGELGNGDRKIRQSVTEVGSDTDWATVSVGGWTTCAVKRSGTAWCWGRNDFGQLGRGGLAGSLRPVRVATDADFLSVATTWSDACGLTSDGQILCWGLNDHGQLGDGTLAQRTTPVAVAGGYAWASVSVGDSHTCGVDQRGGAWCWGSNRYGQLGNGTRTDSDQPVAVSGGRTWTSVDLGWLHTCGLGTDGGVDCWGLGEHGQLLRGTTDDALTP